MNRKLSAIIALVITVELPSHSQQTPAADPMFQDPYVDLDEPRDKPVRHRYVHGGFTGTQARFSFYFPPKEQYQGRFFQHITPVPSSENLAQQSSGEDDKLGFSIASGGYFVETNGGSLAAIAGDQTIPGYRVNAAAAEYSRILAAQMYGPHRTYGYAFGGSGGGYKTIAGFENTSAWDGAVPYVIGSPMAIPNVFTARLLALRVLKGKFPSIVDAVEPGGSGDMYQGLDQEQKDVLREVTRLGFPPMGWFNYKTIGPGAFPVLFGLIRQLDPGYFVDFWKMPGYAGANPPPSLSRAQVQHKATVTKLLSAGATETKTTFGGVDTAWQQLPSDAPVGFQLDSVPSGDLEGAFLMVKSGESAGKDLPVGKVVGNTVFIAVNPLGGNNSQALKGLKPGPILTGTGTRQSGIFKGKMIVCESLMDQDAFPWQADWCRAKVQVSMGDRLDSSFRLWYTENAIHGDDPGQRHGTHTVSYIGVLHQALRDLSAWVEKGVAPPPSTTYRMVDGQVSVPATAAERGGIQPTIIITANDQSGGTKARAGQPIHLTAVLEVPPKTGRIVSADWDFEGAGTFGVAGKLTGSAGSRTVLKVTHTFTKPGTYFTTLRATSQRQGDGKTLYARIHNLGRVRVVVIPR